MHTLVHWVTSYIPGAPISNYNVRRLREPGPCSSGVPCSSTYSTVCLLLVRDAHDVMTRWRLTHVVDVYAYLPTSFRGLCVRHSHPVALWLDLDLDLVIPTCNLQPATCNTSNSTLRVRKAQRVISALLQYKYLSVDSSHWDPSLLFLLLPLRSWVWIVYCPWFNLESAHTQASPFEI